VAEGKACDQRRVKVRCSRISGLVESTIRFLAIMENPRTGGQSLKSGLSRPVHFSTWSGAGLTGGAMIVVSSLLHSPGVILLYAG
jgi:hypothetical protein